MGAIQEPTGRRPIEAHIYLAYESDSCTLTVQESQLTLSLSFMEEMHSPPMLADAFNGHLSPNETFYSGLSQKQRGFRAIGSGNYSIS